MRLRNKIIRRFYALAVGLSLAVSVSAFEPGDSKLAAADTVSPAAATKPYRYKTVASALAVGGVNNLDTYLTPEKYRGTEFRFVSEVVRVSAKRPLTSMLTHDVAFFTARNRAMNARQIGGHYDFAYALVYRWTLCGGDLSLNAGGMADVNLGFCYNMRNSSNNPAQGYASLDFGAQVLASYRFTLWRKSFRVNYTARMPLVGVGFSPNYGQSYYEIFQQGDYDRNAVFRSVAVPQVRHSLTLDIPAGKCVAVRVGYLGDCRQATPNNLRQHTYTHAGVIGVVITK